MLILWFLLSLIPIIFFHELAHLITAKLVGCGVETFSIGFGKPLFKKKIGETTYQITPWLFGGYCNVEGETSSSDSLSAFSNLRYRNKVLMITAGCAVNIITGLIVIGLEKIGLYYYPLHLFGYLSFWLGVTNLIPFPALDGSYSILVWLEKFMGKEKGYELMGKIVGVGFVILMTLNIVSVGFLLWIFRYEILLKFIDILWIILSWATQLAATGVTVG